MNDDLSEQENKELMEIAGSKDVSPETKVKLMKQMLNNNGHSDVDVGHGRQKSKQQNPPVGLKQILKKYMWVGILVVVGFLVYLAITDWVMFLSIVIFVGIVGGYGYYEIRKSKKRKEERAKK